MKSGPTASATSTQCFISTPYNAQSHSFHSISALSTITIRKVFSSQSDFNYSWDEVSTGNWRKYSPWNEKTPHVIAVDTLSRNIDPSTGIVSFTIICLSGGFFFPSVGFGRLQRLTKDHNSYAPNDS